MNNRTLTIADCNDAMRAIADAFDDPVYRNDMLR